MPDADAWNEVKPQLLSGFKAGLTIYKLVVATHKERIAKA
jgi:hypothetical protein